MNYITTNSFWTFKLWIVNSQSDVMGILRKIVRYHNWQNICEFTIKRKNEK